MMVLTTLVVASLIFLFLAFALYQRARQSMPLPNEQIDLCEQGYPTETEDHQPGSMDSNQDLWLRGLAPHLEQKKREEELAVALAMAMAEHQAWKIARDVAEQRCHKNAGASLIP